MKTVLVIGNHSAGAAIIQHLTSSTGICINHKIEKTENSMIPPFFEPLTYAFMPEFSKYYPCEPRNGTSNSSYNRKPNRNHISKRTKMRAKRKK
jgi:hypothetical protein